MGYGVMAFCVNWKVICDFYGCNDLQYMNNFLNSPSFKYSEDRLNEMIADQDPIDEMIDLDQVNCVDYVKSIVTGKIKFYRREGDGSIYHYILKALCDFKGFSLDNYHWMPNQGLYLLFDCLKCEIPIPELPPPDDWPGFFAVPPENIEETLNLLKNVKIESLKDSYAELDKECVDQMISWFELAWKIPGNGVFMFQH